MNMYVWWRTIAVRVIAMFVMLMGVIVCNGLTRMLMRAPNFNRHQIHQPMTHTALGDQRL